MNFEAVRTLIGHHFKEYYEKHNVLDLIYIQGVINGVTALCQIQDILSQAERDYLTTKFQLATNLILIEQLLEVEDDEE